MHPTSTRWSCKNREDLQSPFVLALSNNTRYSFPGRQVGTQDKTTSYASSGDGWTTLKQRTEGGKSKIEKNEKYSKIVLSLY